ncbi:response regulator [Thiorhodovibrio frisius]|uniref:hypothetical protein n=1 Tax=Thiorhodovibrio frisius TaxID=631362 RepID=UPI00022C748C|nr:hypothetical protein [Thiorhodovibrio frisius]WPL21191.1 hypothetical protein Thiofri_01302 [Thiorhodovibrio frisius]
MSPTATDRKANVSIYRAVAVGFLLVIFAISADAMLEGVEQGLAAGFAYYLSKPLNFNTLEHALLAVLKPAA